MASQTSYAEQLSAYAGLRYGMDHKARSGVNDLGSSKQVHTMTVTGVSASTAYTFTVLDSVTGQTFTVTITSAASGETVTTIRDALIAAGRALKQLEGVVSFNPSGTDTIRITAIKAGVGFTAAETDANITNAVVTANATPESLFWGRGVIKRAAGGDKAVTVPGALADRAAFIGVLEREHQTVDPSNASRPSASPGNNLSIVLEGGIWVEVDATVAVGQRAYCRFVAGGSGAGLVGQFRGDPGGTAQVMRITVGGATNAGVYRAIVNGRVAEYIGDGTATVTEVTDGLAAAINALDEPVTAVSTGAGGQVNVTARDPGRAFTLSELSDPGTDIAVTTVTANVAGFAFAVDAEFESSTTGAGLAKLRINRPQPGARAY